MASWVPNTVHVQKFLLPLYRICTCLFDQPIYNFSLLFGSLKGSCLILVLLSALLSAFSLWVLSTYILSLYQCTSTRLLQSWIILGISADNVRYLQQGAHMEVLYHIGWFTISSYTCNNFSGVCLSMGCLWSQHVRLLGNDTPHKLPRVSRASPGHRLQR